ncbi:MAG: zinc ribbon domain-containing protein, partial [Actinomycetota bacterium]
MVVPTGGTMICVNGHENADGVRFCGACGANMAAGTMPYAAQVGAAVPPTNALSLQSLRADLLDDLNRHRQSGYPVTLQTVLAMVSGALY